MRRWVVLFMVGVLFLSSFGFAGQFQEVKDSQVPVSSKACGTCSSCQDFDVDKALSEVNARIGNLTKVINQKEAELQKFYAELNRTKSIETLEKIIKLEDEARVLGSELEFYKRRKLGLELIKKYTRKTPYGLQVLYYRLPREDELVKQYIEKVHPVRKDVDLDWFIAYYTQAAELTFDEYFEADIELNLRLKSGNITDKEAIQLLNKRKKLSEEIFEYLKERDKLQTIKNLNELGRKQLMMKTIGVEPLGIYGISQGYSCNTCPSKATLLPSTSNPEGTPGTSVYYYYASPVAVWVGMHITETPQESGYIGQYCTYELPSSKTDVRKYWWWAESKFEEICKDCEFDLESIQVKVFYAGLARNSNSGQDQRANLIWQFECNKNECYLTSYRPELRDNPDDPIIGEYFLLYVNPYCLACCNGGDVGSTCLWSNRHCSGCFAPDASASQYFPWVNHPYQMKIWPEYGRRLG